MAIEIVDFPINSMVDLSIAMLNYQRVFGLYLHLFAAARILQDFELCGMVWVDVLWTVEIGCLCAETQSPGWVGTNLFLLR